MRTWRITQNGFYPARATRYPSGAANGVIFGEGRGYVLIIIATIIDERHVEFSKSLEARRANTRVTSMPAVDIIIFGDYVFYDRSKNLFK